MSKYYVVSPSAIRRLPTEVEFEHVDINFKQDCEKHFIRHPRDSRSVRVSNFIGDEMVNLSDPEIIAWAGRLPDNVILKEEGNGFVEYFTNTRITSLYTYFSGYGVFLDPRAELKEVSHKEVLTIIKEDYHIKDIDKKDNNEFYQNLFKYSYEALWRRFNFIAAMAYKEDLNRMLVHKQRNIFGFKVRGQ